MAVEKDDIAEIVRVFYQSPFKVFYVNSTDGGSFSRITGAFVSLGLTVSKKTLSDISAILNGTGKYVSRLAELKSTRDCGQFMNSITSETDPEPYQLVYPPDAMDRDTAGKLLKELISECKEPGEKGFQRLFCDIQSLRELIGKLDNSRQWENARIIRKEDTFKIFYGVSNFKEESDGTCYRLGIYVEEK